MDHHPSMKESIPHIAAATVVIALLLWGTGCDRMRPVGEGGPSAATDPSRVAPVTNDNGPRCAVSTERVGEVMLDMAEGSWHRFELGPMTSVRVSLGGCTASACTASLEWSGYVDGVLSIVTERASCRLLPGA